MNFLYNIGQLFLYDPENPLLFNSGFFFLLFSVVLIVYTLIHKKRLAVSLFIIAFSFLFYYKSSGVYVVILGLTAISDYYLALFIHKSQKQWVRKVLLYIALTGSLGLLAFFKYTNFFIDNLVGIVKFAGDFPQVVAFMQQMPDAMNISFTQIVENNFQPLDIFLPIGISFYTFQSVSYVLDVYWRKLEPTHSFIDYTFFLAYFPQLVAGPIVKAHHFLPQLTKTVTITREAIYSGLWLIIVGLIKKAVIADYIAQYNDLVFANPEGYSGFENLMAVYGYTLQIYLDFSGYSDMAIGMARMMGYDLGQNFDLPYQSTNITVFWRKWHISLSSWLRDYIYIPLGGNQGGKYKMYRNLMLTMLIGGLWHGANWKFVFWGGMHGIALALHKASKPWLDKLPNARVINFASWFVTFHFVIFLWVYFRAVSFDSAIAILSQIFTQMDLAYIAPFAEVRYVWIILMLIGFAMHIPSSKFNERIGEKFVAAPYAVKFLILVVAVQLAVQFKLEGVQPFIYFQF